MAQTADELEAEIVRTREDLSTTSDAIGNQMSPNQVVRRNTHRIRNWIKSASVGVMGSDSGESGAAEPGNEGLVGRTAQSSGARTDQVEGNPLAAGIIAFGFGLLVGSVVPATKVERQAASMIADKAEPAISSAMQAAADVAEGVRGNLDEGIKDVGQVLGEGLKTVGQEIVDEAT